MNVPLPSYWGRLKRAAKHQVLPAVEEAVVKAFLRLYRPTDEHQLPGGLVRKAIVEQFHRLYYYDSTQTWRNTRYRGIPTLKCPLDLWVYQELITTVRPALIIETGTNLGGSAFFLADQCELQDRGHVVTIDIVDHHDRPVHDRITYLTGRSTDDHILSTVRSLLPEDGPVMVILDSDHSHENVAAELAAYSPLVTVDSYLIVEDTCMGGNPILPNAESGPMTAVQDFLRSTTTFRRDESCEKFLLTFNPSGYLRRIE